MGDDHGPHLEIKEGFFRVVRRGGSGAKPLAQSWSDEGPTERDLFSASDSGDTERLLPTGPVTLSITQSLHSFRYWRRFGVWARAAAASAVMVDWVFSSLKLHAPHIISWINETFPLGARMFYQPLLSLVIGLLVAVIWLKCRRGMSDQEVADNLAQHIRKESNHTLEGSAAWLAISIPDVLIPVIARYSDAIADIFSAYLAESLGPVLKLCFGVLAAKAIEYCRQGGERPQSPVVDENSLGCSSSA